MSRRTRKNNNASIAPSKRKQQAIVLPFHSPHRGIGFLVALMDSIRPKKKKDIAQANLLFKALLYQLTQDRSLLFSLRKALLSQFLKTNIVGALTESGIISSKGFLQELVGKMLHKILPELQTADNFQFVINKIFHNKSDHLWVEGIDNDLWIQFFELLGIQINLTEPALIKQLHFALQTLSYRVAALGLEREITQRSDNVEEAIFPFIEQSRLMNEFFRMKSDTAEGAAQRALLLSITETLNQCNRNIQKVRNQRMVYGTSLAQTYILTRLQQQINRIFIILDVLDTDNTFNTQRFVTYFTTVVHNENRKNSILEFFSENTGYLAYQIAEHGGRTGQKFITTSKKEFWRMFNGAMGGGIIISFIGILKSLLGKIPMAPFWHGFVNSANYSLGFILIQDTGSTLATKQPAYTANSVVSSFEVQKVGEEPDLRNLAITIGKVSRTQIASFAGNLMIVFPLTYILAWLFFLATGTKIAAGEEAHQLLINQQPLHSFAWLYACFTGFFLFASGIIAGYVENYVVYGKIAERMRTMSSFKNRFSEKRRDKIIRYVENNLGSLVGNISLGFFLGMAGFIGSSFGIPFDIRHITISAANSAIGFFGMDHLVSAKELCYTIVGILGIGFFNFAVSFGLAFFVALKSRAISLRNYPQFAGVLWRYFKKYPKDFIKAPTQRNVEQLY